MARRNSARRDKSSLGRAEFSQPPGRVVAHPMSGWLASRSLLHQSRAREFAATGSLRPGLSAPRFSSRSPLAASMAPGSTAVSIRLTEPVLFLTGGTEAERARARRRRAIGTPLRTPANSRPGSRAPSPPPGISAIVEGNYVPPFVAPSPAWGAAGRNMSPAPGAAAGGSRSASRTRVTEGTTTGSGSAEEAAAADEPPPALLRGLLTLTLAKPSRIRNISVKLKGVARTDWPEGASVVHVAELTGCQELARVGSMSWKKRCSSPSRGRSSPLRTSRMSDGRRPSGQACVRRERGMDEVERARVGRPA